MHEKFIPLDIGPEIVELYKCDGEVHPIRDFTSANLKSLSEIESIFIKENFNLLPDSNEIPNGFRQCMSRSSEAALSSTPLMTAQRSGARSAFVPEIGLQLKGCRPVLGGEKFPTEILLPGSTQITRKQIPFGVMTAEAILREVLGFCFMKKNGLPLQAIPLAAVTYLYKEKPVGLGMLLRVKSEVRVEKYIELPHCTIRHLINMQTDGVPLIKNCAVGSELRLQGMNLWKYVETKGRILAAMNWEGGFRGLLNSNFGNDVLVPDGEDHHRLTLADFDTFCLVPVPGDDNKEILDPFVLRCLLEVTMGSLPIMQYVNVPQESSQEKISDVLGAIYFKKSSLWRSYYRHFLSEAKARGIGPAAIGESIRRMRRTEAFTEILKCRILSNTSFLRSDLERPFYYPHN